MGLLSRLLGRRQATGAASAADSTQPARHEGRTPYDATLIGALRAQHQELLRICAAVKSATAEHRFNDIQHLLTHFKLTYQTHTGVENARFYSYLHQRMAHERGAFERVDVVRREMNELGFEVLKVVDAYIAYPPTHLTETQFKYEFEQAADLLARRVQKVESELYPLYRP